jgi:hypothetical protein
MPFHSVRDRYTTPSRGMMAKNPKKSAPGTAQRAFGRLTTEPAERRLVGREGATFVAPGATGGAVLTMPT